MKTKILLLIMIMSSHLLLAQNIDSTKVDIFDMSLEELLDIEINVASTKGNNIFSAPSSVTVVTKEDIERFGFSTVTEVLQSIAGFSVERTV